MNNKEITLYADISPAFGWSKMVKKQFQKAALNKIDEFRKAYKLKKKEIDYKIKYQAKIDIRIYRISKDQRDLMEVLDEK